MIALLPDASTIHRRIKAAAALDCVISPEWQYRYYSYDPRFVDNGIVGSMRNGSGEDFAIAIKAKTMLIKGYTKVESDFSGENPVRMVLDNMNAICRANYTWEIAEVAFEWTATSYAYWLDDNNWKGICGSRSEEVCREHLGVVLDDGDSYCEWVPEYYERKIDAAIVKQVFMDGKITLQQAKTIYDGTELELDAVLKELKEIGAM